MLMVNVDKVTLDEEKKLKEEKTKKNQKTRMHSSRMRTGRSLTVCRGGVLPSGGWVGCFLPGGVLPSRRGGGGWWYPSMH